MGGSTMRSDQRGGAQAFRVALDALYLWAGYLAGFFLIAIFVLMMVLAVGRQVGFNIPSGDDFAAWSMAAMSFLGLAHTFKRGEMIRVGLLVERITGRKKQAAELIALTISLIFVSYFAREIVRLAYDSWRFNDVSQGVVSVPLAIPQAGCAAGIVLLVIALVDEINNVIRGRRPTYEKEPAATPEELIDRIASGGGV